MEKDTPKYCSYLWGGHILYLGRLDGNTEHAHHALQVIINRKGQFKLRIEEASIECGGIIIRSDCRHMVFTPTDYQIHLFIERHDAVARTIAEKQLGKKNFKILDGALLKGLRGCVKVPGNFIGSCAQVKEVYEKIVSKLGGDTKASEEAIDPRIKAVMDMLKETLLTRNVTIKELARHACLSESRLMHLFKSQIGIPLRRYSLWLRVMAAERLAADGKKSLTEAAHRAGFSDSAHLCRTYRSMFGVALSDCLKNSRFIQVNSCFKW